MQLEGASQVLVIGAGPAGSAAATTLARAGVDVCMVDRARFPRDKTCGDAVSAGAMRLLDAMGVAADVLARPHASVVHASAVFPGGERIGRDYPQPGYIVGRSELDDALRRGAERAGATVLEGVAVRRVLRDPETDFVVGARGDRFRWRAGVTIAADGPFSVALPALGCERPRGRHVGVAATAYLRGVTFPAGPATADHYIESELPLGYGWIFPAVEGLSNVGVYQRRDAYGQRSGGLRAAFEAFLDRHPERFCNAERVGRVRNWSLPLAAPPHAISAPGLLLAGDAACLVDPLSGEGIWQAIFSGVEAAKTAAGAIAEGNLSPRLRKRYERAIKTRIARPSFGKRAVQHCLQGLVKSGLYRLRPLRGSVRRIYAGGFLEMTKRS